MRGSRTFGMRKTSEVTQDVYQVLVQTYVIRVRSIRQRAMEGLG